MSTNSVSGKINLPEMEEKIYTLWQSENTFAETIKMSVDRPQFNFYDGPPFATGSPHYGHLLAAAIKDTICRFQTLNGRYVPRKNGWDTHGLPIEQLGERALGVKTATEIHQMGIDKFNAKCRSLVLSCAAEWETIIPRFGRWIDFAGGYKTMDFEFMNATWAVFRTVFDKGLVYQGLRPMPFSTGCGSCLSHFEAKSNYQETNDPSLVVRFPLINSFDVLGLPNIDLLVWTTTPYSLTGNIAVCINPELEYVLAMPSEGHLVILAAAAVPRFETVFGLQVIRTITQEELRVMKYSPPFDYNNPGVSHVYSDKWFTILMDTYVKADSGTGIVHMAPGMGEDDYRVCLRYGLIDQRRPETIPCPIDNSGHMTVPDCEWSEKFVKDADKLIIRDLKSRGLVFDSQTIHHSYPFCYRTDTPLIQKAVPAWFIDVHTINTRMNNLNRTGINWVPASVGSARFAQWLETPHDWAFGRSRFWGTPVPIWTDAACDEVVCISSVAELESLAGLEPGSIQDLHMDTIDRIRVPSKLVPGTWLTRIPDVFDCWFESGAMPYGKFAVEHKLRCGEMYEIFQSMNMPEHATPSTMKLQEEFLKSFPADFIGEGIDQTRGWFYTLLVLSTILMDNTAYRNVVVNGHILAADPRANGKWVKMSKRHKNYSSPMDAINKYGADSVRLYLLDSPVSHGESLKFNEPGVLDKGKFLVQWYNCYQFLEQEIRMFQKTSFGPGGNEFEIRPTNQVYDHWILGRLLDFVNKTTDAYARYELSRVIPMMLEFEALFSKWYINLSKTKIKGACGKEPQFESLSTLWTVLHVFAVVMSPVCPFMSETIYRGLIELVGNTYHQTAPKSVHQVLLKDIIPQIQSQYDPVLAAQADSLVAVVMSTRALKTQLGQSARLRSNQLVIRAVDSGFLDNVRCLEAEIRTAIKVSNVSYARLDLSDPNSLAVKFNTIEINKLSRAKSQTVLAKLSKLTAQDVLGRNELVVNEIIIPCSAWEVYPNVTNGNSLEAQTCVPKNEMVSIYRADDRIMVSLSRETSMSAAEIALADLLKDIQRAKKTAGLRPENICDIYIRCHLTGLTDLFQTEQEYVDERLRCRIHLNQLPSWTIWNTHRYIGSMTGLGNGCKVWSYDIYLEGPVAFRTPESIIQA
jgi:isoleucyl-tRNA synthetase